MKVIGIYNIKGGVGKTATAVNLGYLSARNGLRTLIWDLDPQGASSYYFRVQPKIKGAKKLARGKIDLDEAIKATDYEGLDLLPADFAFRNLDLLLEEQKNPAGRLRKLIKPLSAEYDRIYLDCPPSISLVSENVFQASSALIIPTIPTTLSLRTLEQLTDFLAGHELGHLPVWPLFSMADRRKRLHQSILQNPPQSAFGTIIPYASDVERMGEERRPVPAFSTSGTVTRAYGALWKELEGRLGGIG